MLTDMKPPVAYAGGKTNVASYLVALFPPHNLYVDLFCGGLSVSLTKPRDMSGAEWFNDKYDILVNFFRVIKECPDKFIDYFKEKYVIDSETEYMCWVDMLRNASSFVEMPNVDLAVAFWMTQEQTFTGRNAEAGASYRYVDKRFGKRHYLDLDVGRIRSLHDRLQGVQIFCRDFRHIFKMVSHEETTFIFEDPPYWDTQGGNDYAMRFTWQDHVDLSELNKGTKAKWLLTINDHPDIRKLYEGWAHIRPYSFRYYIVKEVRTELLISNYDTAEQFGPLFNLLEEQ